MKKFVRIMAVLTVLAMLLSVSVVSSYAAEFGDYYTEPSCIFGDVDNDFEINVKDATTVQKYLAKFVEISDSILEYADVNASGDVTISDATLIQKYVACIIEWFPAEEDLNLTQLVIGESANIEFSYEDSFMAEFTVEEEGFYNITATPKDDCSFSYMVTCYDNGNVWHSEADGESVYCYGLFGEGLYRIVMFADSECDVKVSLKVEKTEDQPLFDFESAKELKLGDRVELEADGSLKVFKVDNTAMRDQNDAYYIYTQGGNTQVNITVYSEVYAVISEGMPLEDDGNNVGLYVYDDYLSDWSYIVVECYEDGEDFTLCCESSDEALKDMADEVIFGNVYEIEIEFYEGSSVDEVATQGVGSALYSFTPETSDYYSLEYSYEGCLFVLHGIEGFENPEDNDLVFSRQTNEGKIKDVRYFEAHTTYYIATIVGTETDDAVKFEIGTSTEEEYNQIRLEDEELFPEEEEATLDEMKTNPLHSFVEDNYKTEIFEEDDYYIIGINFAPTRPEFVMGSSCVHYTLEDKSTSHTTIEKDGKTYHWAGGSGGFQGWDYYLTETEIVVTEYTSGPVIGRFTLNSDGSLYCTYGNNNEMKAGYTYTRN